MYNPPKKEKSTGYNQDQKFEYHEEYLLVYEQGRELAKQKKPFVNPYSKIVDINTNHHEYELVTYIRSFRNDLSDWYYNGYFDYKPDDDNPKAPKVPVTKATLEQCVEFESYFSPSQENRGNEKLKVKKARKPIAKKKLVTKDLTIKVAKDE